VTLSFAPFPGGRRKGKKRPQLVFCQPQGRGLPLLKKGGFHHPTGAEAPLPRGVGRKEERFPSLEKRADQNRISIEDHTHSDSLNSVYTFLEERRHCHLEGRIHPYSFLF
jgi:hypothetical protein